MHQLVFTVVVLGSAVASATPNIPGLAPLPKDLPARCAPLAITPASAKIAGPTFAAHVSVANCMAEVAMNAAAAGADDAAIAKLDAAVAPSLAILDSVIAAGDAAWKRAAESAKRDIFTSMIVRERVTVPALDVAGHAALEPKLARWQDAANQATSAIAQLTASPPRQMARR